MKLVIASEYTKTPGGRYAQQGEHSGEDFREKMLLPRYLEAVSGGEKLLVDFDGGYGYATSFLEESFGGLVRKMKDPRVLDHLEFKSEEEPGLIKKVQGYVKNAIKELS